MNINKELIDAIDKNDINKIEELLKQGANPNIEVFDRKLVNASSKG